MYCDNCGSRNDFDAVFCKKCGLNFNNNRKKINNKKKRQHMIEEIKREKDIILPLIIIVMITIFSVVSIFKNSTNHKYKAYLKKQGFKCHDNVCTKDDSSYKTEITLKSNRLIYKKSKVNEIITFNYAGEDLGDFLIEDSLSKFNCSFISGKINENSCANELSKAGKENYLSKMNDILEETRTIIKKSNIKF